MQHAQNRPLFILPWIGIVVGTFAATGEWLVKDAPLEQSGYTLTQNESPQGPTAPSALSPNLKSAPSRSQSERLNLGFGPFELEAGSDSPKPTSSRTTQLLPPSLQTQQELGFVVDASLRASPSHWFRPSLISAPLLEGERAHRGAKHKLVRLPNGLFLHEWVLFYDEALPEKKKLAHALNFIQDAFSGSDDDSGHNSSGSSSDDNQGTHGDFGSGSAGRFQDSVDQIIDSWPGAVKIIAKADSSSLLRLKRKLSALR
jgi:hypothetical protein